MGMIITENSTMALWVKLVQHAGETCQQELDVELESYLVFMLMRFADKPQCIARIMAEDYLNSQALHGEQRAGMLREVGDHCLLFSGLFPQLAERRLVRISYFVNIGRASYRQLSAGLDRGWSSVYGHLSDAFIVLMDILHAMRGLGGAAALTPLQAMDLWLETGSRRCYQQVCGEDRAIPVTVGVEKH